MAIKKHILHFLKIAVPVAIIVWLVADVQSRYPETFSDLAQRPKNWPLLVASACLSMAAVCLTFVRWYLLVRALGIPFPMRDAFRLGFLGYLLNFVSLGSVGGDLFKAFFVARQVPDRRAESVATVVVDRVVGLYALLVVATIALLVNRPANPPPEVVAIAWSTYAVTGAGTIGLLAMFVPGITSGTLSEFLAKLPKVGATLAQLLGAVRIYRRRVGTLAAILLMSLAVHALATASLYLAAVGLFGVDDAPTLAEHFIIVPLGMLAGILPTPAGLGTIEITLNVLYRYVPVGGGVAGHGLIVALAYRVITIVIAAIGVGYYWTSRREVADVMHEAEEEGV